MRLFFAILCALPVACISAKPNASSTKQIIGADDSVVVATNIEQLALPLRIGAAAVTLMKVATGSGGHLGFCTASHIGNGRFVTAAHCFQDTAAALGETAEQFCGEVSVEWRFPPVVGETVKSAHCIHVIDLRRDNKGDWAIFQADDAPDELLRFHEKVVGVPSVGDKISVLGYASAGPLRWSGACRILASDGTNIGTHLQDSPSFFNYDCDTLPGDSGAPVMLMSDFSMIGVHTGSTVNDGVSANRATLLLAPLN